jgi:nucleotide-binding universal stress UspA family protein
MAQKLGARLIVAHVVEPLWYPHDWDYMPLIERKGAGSGRIGTAARETEARQHLRKFAGEKIDRAVQVTPVVRTGTPWNEIVALAKEIKADLIVIGTHGRTGIKHVVMGSTAERVVRHASCPVLVVR